MNISTNITSGTVYLIWLNSTGQFYNGSTFENYASGNYGTYDVAATITGGRVTATPPTDATDYQLRLQAGGSPATTDAIVDADPIPVTSSGSSGDTIAIDGDSVEIN